MILGKLQYDPQETALSLSHMTLLCFGRVLWQLSNYEIIQEAGYSTWVLDTKSGHSCLHCYEVFPQQKQHPTEYLGNTYTVLICSWEQR